MLRATACCCALLAFAPVARAAWIELKSGPFVVLTEAGDDPAREALLQEEQFRHALGAALGRTDLKTAWPVTLVVQKAGRGLPGAPELLLAREGYLSTWPAGGAPGRAWWKRLALLLLDGSLAGRMPQGFEEALADLYSTLEIKGVRLTLGAPPPAAERTRAWALLHLLATNPETAGRFRVLLFNLSRGAGEDTAYRNAFEQPKAALDTRLEEYLKAGVYGSVPVSGLPLNTERFAVIPARPSQVRLLAADLALARGEWAPARAAYQAVVQQNPAPNAHEGLVLALLGEGHTQDARLSLAAAVAGEGAGPRAFYEAGRLEPDWPKAVKLLEAAAHKNSAWAAPWVVLANREPGITRKALVWKKVVEVEPRHAAHWRAYAEALEAAGQHAEAVKSWRQAELVAVSDAERAELGKEREAGQQRRLEAEAAERTRKAQAERDEMERLRNETQERIRQAEERARQAAGPVKGGKIEQWWDGPAATRLEAVLERVGCQGREARLHLRDGAGKPVLLLIPDPAKIVLAGGGFTTFPCGPLQPPRKVRVEYLPKPDPKKGTAGEAVFLEFP